MKQELSILIPVYNTICTQLVLLLADQCRSIAQADKLFRYEIIVADDASTCKECLEANAAINDLDDCRYVVKPTNTGSAATRNYLASIARYDWLMFLDSDMQIPSPRFVHTYLNQEAGGVINGGVSIAPFDRHNLRYLYEKACEPAHTPEQRARRPYQSFRSANFLIQREAMLRCPFDERFTRSGYEDVMLGKQLHGNGIPVHHIDNPVSMTDFEPNVEYMDKIDRSLATLCRFRQELRGYSRLITIDEGIHLKAVRGAVRLWQRLAGPLIRRILCSRHPCLKLFNLYRIGYYISLTKNDSQL